MNNSDMPAMPFTEKPEYQYTYCGLTKREHFAAMAMQAMLSNPHRKGSAEQCADSAINYADALLRGLS